MAKEENKPLLMRQTIIEIKDVIACPYNSDYAYYMISLNNPNPFSTCKTLRRAIVGLVDKKVQGEGVVVRQWFGPSPKELRALRGQNLLDTHLLDPDTKQPPVRTVFFFLNYQLAGRKLESFNGIAFANETLEECARNYGKPIYIARISWSAVPYQELLESNADPRYADLLQTNEESIKKCGARNF